MPINYDKPLFYITLAFFIGGLLILASASMVLSQKAFGMSGYYVLRQSLFGGLGGVIGFFIASRIPYRFWKKAAIPLMICSLIFMAVLFLPGFGYSFGGARRWISVGPLSFQPSEILKFSFWVYLAGWLEARKNDVVSVSRGMIPFAFMLSVIGIFLLMQPDIGTLGVIVVSAGLLYFLGGGKTSQIITLVLFGAAAFYFIVQLAPYRLARITAFLNPAADPQGIGYQINQAFIAIGSGGFWGRGFGMSLQKYQYLPESMGDSIFAIFSEEFGFFGSAIFIGLWGVFLLRGFSIARRAPDLFGKFLAAGIIMGITVQSFINMAAISGLMPLTGIPLPFVSYGGTALMVTLIQIGVLLNIAKHT
ncbi:MAG: putative lipid II flippase FtsW [Candidatus Sungbacteria bacterium]|nr:putative lipid II flippase FtsW [Candidatus Sungbacteria bacterium]